LGETLWYLAKSNDLAFIKYYLNAYGRFAEANGTVHGAYGPRMFEMRGGINQINNVIRILRKKPNSRQAVVQLFNAEDLLKDYKDIPCTCTLQYLVRKGALNVIVHMRSNDAFVGLPHDVFAFTFLQELIARALGLRMGTYLHMVGSLHIYDDDRAKVARYLNEAYQARVSMPRMPTGDPWKNLRKLIEVESKIRQGVGVQIDRYTVPHYWRDLMRLLQVFALNKQRRSTRTLRSKMASSIYDAYIDRSARRSG
jgi:thymidylate synthase